MTSEEINEYKKRNDAIDLIAFWLREIAFQLAVMNEQPRCSQCHDIVAHMPSKS